MNDYNSQKNFLYITTIKAVIILIFLIFVVFGYWYIVDIFGFRNTIGFENFMLEIVYIFFYGLVLILSLIPSVFTFFNKKKSNENCKNIFIYTTIIITILVTIIYTLVPLFSPDSLFWQLFYILLIFLTSFSYSVSIAVLLQGIINYYRRY